MDARYLEKAAEYTAAMTASGRPPRAFVMTFGCQQNEADSERMAGLCTAMGYTLTEREDDADLILVNTCAIREHAEQRALSVIGRYKHLKKQNPDLVIGVGGCMVSQAARAEKLKLSYPYVSFVFDTASIARIPEYLCRYLETHKRIFSPAELDRPIAEGMPVCRASSFRAWVSIMYGCNNFCAYCIVPYVRGRERSRAPEAVLDEVCELVAAGYKEITLLGQNVNSYGKDLAEPCTFAELLAKVSEIPGEFVVRFMSSHPKDASDELIRVMSESPKIEPHFHLPLQSGSDSVLARMNRRYTRERYLSIVKKLREAMPEIAITTDIIVGLPGETEADFEDTLTVMREAQFDMIYPFRYSPRKGTPAAEMETQIPEDVKAARFDRLIALQNEISLAQNERYIGRTERVLVDACDPDKQTASGRTDSGKLVHLPHVAPIGTFLPVRITRADTFALYGEAENTADAQQ